MATLQITCLGDCQIALDGAAPNTALTEKARSLLIYLTLEPKVHQRSDLTKILWSGYSDESARNSLRQALHLLRQSLPEGETPWLLVTRQTVQINPAAAIIVDVTTFTGLLAAVTTHAHADLATCATCLVHLRQAVDLYRGDFLAGLGAIDSDGFEEWRRVTQEQLHIQMLDALAQLAYAAEGVGDTDGALQAARRQLTLEPWLETAHRQIMRLLAQRGQRTSALAQYQRCRQVLAEELSVEPDEETTALHELIRSGAFDKATRRQGDKVNSTSVHTQRVPGAQAEVSVTESPHYPVTQPPRSADIGSPLGAKPHPVTPSSPEWLKAAATPAQLPPLLGREDELAQLTTLLAQPACRLVTLVGPPGVGKTRLAQEILDFRSFQDKLWILDSPTDFGTSNALKPKIQNPKFEGGVYFIDLSALRDPALLAAAIAQSLTAAETSLPITSERLIEQMRDQALLLVFDNFEQVLPGAALLGQLLAHCPRLKLLVTSRVPLHLPGEQVMTVQPLSLPDLTKGSQGAVTLATVADNGAVQLFCQRAAAVAPGFVLTERLAPVVIEICRRLDGLPLAIELAAARCRLLPPPALLERLTQDLPARLALLTNRSQTLPERQQTLRAAIAWSYDLLTPAEQRLFRQMAVFVGGATLAALEAVIRPEGATGESQHPPHALLDNIEALLDKSLLRQQEPATHQPEGESRLLLLETLREYGWELLTATAEGHSTQQRHADYFLTLAETAAPKLHGPEQVIWLDRLALDHDNLRAALDWFVQAGEAIKALRLATALRYFWRVRGHYREGSERLQQILARPEAVPTGSPTDPVLARARARALNAAGYLQWVQGNAADAQKLLQEALTLGRAVPDAAATAFALRYLGLAADARQERATARQLLEESLALYRSLATPNETALALMYLGDVAFGQQAYGEAEQLYQESADLLRSLGNNVVLPYALRHLGYLALVRGDLPTALALSTESLRLNLVAGEQQGSAAALSALATVAVASERWVQAGRLLSAVTAWLAASRAQLLPIDRTYYEQTAQHLQQRRQGNPPDALVDEAAPLSLAQALAYVQQELTFADEPGRQGDKVTSDKVTSRPEANAHGVHSVTLSPPHPITPPHNLPSSSSLLVGRDQALAEIAAQFQRAKCRLLTLVGPGGMGKTRLAVEVGRAQLSRFADGVWFVPLAAISTADALPGAIATALGITLQGSEPRQALLQSLSAQHLLLLLDNYEHLLVEEAAVDLVVDLLARAPGVQILITSRQRLNLRGEQLYPVQALTFPSTVTLAEATSASAVRLFVQAVQRVQADFQLTTTNLPAVLRICQLVQGMPLGLELAAANAGSAPLRAIADALEQSAEILAVEWRDLPARQRSMRAVFAWSWQLLSAAEQRVLRQCAHFRGGFDYTAAQAVIGATPALLTALVNKSLLQWQAGASGEGRYAMHELLRQFAAEALAESSERAVVEERHGRYYLAYLAARGFRLGRGEPKEASAEIGVELDNVRLAWHWAATQGGLAELDQAFYAWWQFCLLQGLGGEAQQSLAAALVGVRTHLTRQADDGPLRLLGTRLLAKLLALHANYLFAQGHDEEMAAQAREAMQLGAASGGFEGEILGSYVLGRVLQDTHQKREAQALWEQTIQLVQRYQPQQPENELLHELHWMAHIMLRGSALHFGDYNGCRAHIVEALRICQTLGKQRGELTCLSCLGEINFFLYDFAAAEADYRAELALGRSLGYRLSEMSAQEGLARVARLRGDYATARTLFEQSLSSVTELAFHYDEALLLAALIRLHCQLGDQTAAAASLARLTQLLAQVQLGKECRLYGYLAAAFKAHYAGDKDEALAAAEEADRINQQGGDILFRLVDTALILGHVRAAAGQWEAAQSAFQEALSAFQQFSNHALSAEPQAGLAQIALAQGDRGGALAQIEALLPVLAQEPHAGYNDPIFIYLTGYRVLVANGDSRAATLLQQGYDLLHQDAAALDDESRQRFLAVPLHRDLAAAYAEMQDKVTRRQGDKAGIRALVAPAQSAVTEPVEVTAGSVTESPNHSLTPSPPHPLTLSPLLDWAEMPMVDFFVERKAEVAQLTAWLTPTAAGGAPAQLISILGMGGMGKTTLAAAVTKAVAPNFAVVIWRSLLNAPPLNELLHNWLQVLSRQHLTTLPESLDEQLRLLLTYLQQERCLLVLDNVESIFVADTPAAAGTSQPQSRAGVVRLGYEGYDQLFQRLASSDHQSCLLLTSREQPYALLRLATGRRGQAQPAARLQVLPLAGLDQMAGQALLVSNGLHAATAEIAQLVENYSGNPLALQIVAATIADFFGGDVAAFQQEEGQLFDGMRLVLDQQFARLSPLEREILIWLAIEREPITVPMLRSNFIQSVATAPLLEALQALQNRSLLEKRDSGLTLQNVIIEYSTEYLVAQVCEEILDFGFWIVDSSVDDSHATIQNPKSKIQNLCLNRFALLKAQAKEYVRQSQARLILQPVAQQLLNRLGQASLLTRVQEVLALLRTYAPHMPGYAAGNLLNLLLTLGIDLTDYDFSDLCVWQPYLREKTLTQFNFTNADLRGAAFTDTFDIVRSLAYSPDGRWLAAGTSDGEIRLWRATDGQLLANVKGHGDIVGWLCFLDDGKTLISYSHDLALAMWQVGAEGGTAADGEAGGVVTLRLRYRNSELSNLTNLVAFHPQNELLVFGTERAWLCLWHLGAKRQLSEQTINVGQIHTIHFSPDGKTLALGASDRRIHLWAVDASTGRLVLRQSLAEMPASARDLSFRADGRTLASGHEDGAIYLWALDAAGDCATGQAVQVLSGHRAGVWRVVFSPDGQVLASASDDQSVRLWAIEEGATAVSAQPLARFDDHRGWVRALAFSPDGRALASAGADRTLRVWDLRRSQLLFTLYGYVKAVKSIAFFPNSHRLVSGSDDQRLRLWSVAVSGRLDGGGSRALQTWAGHTSFIWQVAVSPDGRLVASAGDDRQIYVRDASNGQVFKILSGHNSGATAVAFSPDSKLLASGGIDCRVILWDVQEHSGRSTPIRTWDGGTQVVWTVAFSPNGEYLAFGGEPNRVRLWHLPTQRFLPSLENATGVLRSLAFSPDSRWLAAGGHDAIVYLWQMGSAAPPRLLRGHQNRLRSVAFSPDGRRLATASFDQTVRLWDLQTQTQLRALLGHSNQVLVVAFSTDGALLASASEDETIRLWDGKTGKPLSVLPMPGPYIGMKIDGVTGISTAQKAALKALDAVEDAPVTSDWVTSDTVISDTVTSDWVISDTVTSTSSVTESPSHLVTQSPSHLVPGSPLLDWAEMPRVDFFIERRAEVAQLTEWLIPTAASGVTAQLISILGMGGMGKTTLAAAVTKAVAANFTVVIWRSLLNAPPLDELLRNWLQILSRQTLAALPESVDEQLRLVLTYLQQERCLLVLDNVESIFVADTPAPEGTAQPHSRAGVTRPGYEGYDQLLQRLASSDHQSCLLLTSREQPYALLRSGRQAQTTGRLQVLPLTGLDQVAGQVLLANNGLHVTTAQTAQLVENYSGNPLALQIVAATIADFFGGDVAAFQAEDGLLFDGIRMVLDQQFVRLSPLERDILVWLAIEREAISVSTLRANFVHTLPTSELIEALQALQNRSLLEKHPAGLTLQNVIIEYTTDYLVGQVCDEILDFGFLILDSSTNKSPVTIQNSKSKIQNFFLNRFALLKAQAKEYVRHSQSRLIVQPVVARLLDKLGQNRVEQTLRALIGALSQQPQPATRGYAAGNLLNLLLQAGCALKELDLSHLTVWQAYLRECTLHAVNFSGADLRGSEFADTFTAITTLTYSRDGKFLVAGTSLGDIRVWLAQTLQPIALLQGHSRLIMGLAFGSAPRQLLASGGEDGALRLWNMAKPEEPSVILYQAPGFIRTVAVSPIADLVASAGDDPAIQLWDMQRRRAVAILRGHSSTVTAVVFSADGRYLASCSGDQTVRLWDLSSIEQSVIDQRATPQPHPPVIEKSHTVYTWSPAAADVWQIAISPDNQWLAGVTLDGMVWRWPIDAELTAKPVQVLQAQGAHQMALTFRPDSAQLAVGALSGAIWLLDSHSGEIVRQIEGHKPLTLTLAFAPDGKTLASSGSDRMLRVWEVPTGRSIQALAGAARAFRAAVFGADGKTIVTSAEDQTIRIWEVSATPAPESAPSASTAPPITGFCRHVLRGHSSGIWTVALDHTCTVAASAGEDANILLWDCSSGQQLHNFAGHLDTVTALAFSPDGRTLISGSPDQTVRLWDYRTFTPLAQLRDDSPSISTHEKSIWSVALSPDGALLAAGYSDGGIVLWDIRNAQRCRQIGKLRKHEGWVRTLAFSPDGSLLASGSNDQTVRLWAVKTGSLRHVLHGHSDWVMSVAFHPHGRLLASGSFDSTIRLWDVATGAPIAAPAANVVLPMRHDKGVVAVTFHPAGHLLLSASRDERMTFWHWATQQRLHNLVAPGPYSGLQITGATGLSAAQKAALRALGAVDEADNDKVTSDKMTSTSSVIESPNHPVTLSPPHLLTQSPPHNLPHFSTPLIGREQPVAEIIAHLQRAECRLLTLVGPGGMGKTRLAVETGQRMLDLRLPMAPPQVFDSTDDIKSGNPKFPDGVWFVPLAAINTSESMVGAMVGAIAGAVGIALQGSDPRNVLFQTLRQKQLLLILDNFEQLLVANDSTVELVVGLLETAPRVQIIVTSRERLKVRNEQTYIVPALTVAAAATPAEAADSSAVQLFVQAIRRVLGDFQLTTNNLAAVLRICQLVQGMPLGLELAAAHADALPLPDLADAIAQSSEVLAVSWRDLPERQRSMRSLFTWSWQLLEAEEQRVLRQLSIFRGTFDRSAAQVVADATPRILTSLTHKSLLHWQESATGEQRYALHELLRQFASEKLSDRVAEDQAVRHRHCEYYLNFVAARQQRMARNEPWKTVGEVQENIDNVRLAWDWAVTHTRTDLLTRSFYTISIYFGFIGLLQEGDDLFRLAAETLSKTIDERQLRNEGLTDAKSILSIQQVLCRLFAVRSAFLFRLGKYDLASATAKQAITNGASLNDAPSVAYSYLTLGSTLTQRSHFAEARAMLEQAFRTATSATEQLSGMEPDAGEMLADIEWNVRIWLRLIAKRHNDLIEAQKQNELALRICQQQDRRRGEAVCILYMAGIAAEMGDLLKAHEGYVQALKRAQALGYRWCEGVAKLELGQVVMLQGDSTQAADLMEQALATFREMGDRWQETRALACLIHTHCSNNTVEKCRQYLLAAQEAAQHVDSPEIQSFHRLALARYYKLARHYEKAVDLCRQVLAIEYVGNQRNLTRAYVLLGDIYSDLHCTEDANRAYQQAQMSSISASNAQLDLVSPTESAPTDDLSRRFTSFY